MDIKTHQKVNQTFAGTPVTIEEEHAIVKLEMTSDMVLDETGLIHGGFIFSLADYTAMLTINKPTVVLGGANCRFTVPVKEGDELRAEGMLSRVDGKKLVVDVNIKRGDEVVFIGEFYCFAPEKHVLHD